MESVAGDEVPTGLARIDSTGRILDANSVFADWVGADRRAVLGRSFEDIVRSAEPTDALTGEYLTGLAEITDGSGTSLPVFLKYGQADATGIRFVTVFDASLQRAFREQLLRRHGLVERTQKRLELVIGASIAFAETTSEIELGEVLATTTAEAYAAEESVVFLLDDGGVFQQIAGTNPFVGVDDIETLTVRGRELRSVLKISGVEAAYAVAPSIGAAFEKAGVQAIIIAPIRQRGESLGILAAFFHHPRQFDEQASPLADALAGQAARAISALRLQARLEHAAMHDDTTGLPNRRLFEETLGTPRLTSEAVLAVLFVDLDGFKAVNDQLGHQIGDEVLREVALRLQATVREEDVVARYGGDEFVIVCELPTEDAALEVAERVRRSLREPHRMLPPTLTVGASIGVSLTAVSSTSVERERLVRAADQAMYSAKFAGGDQIVTVTL